MIDSKELILNRIRSSLGKNIGEDSGFTDTDIPREYQHKSDRSENENISLFQERVSEYKAVVQQSDRDKIGKQISSLCSGKGVQSLVIPPGLDSSWTSEINSQTTLFPDSPPLSKEELNTCDAVLTGCFLGVAQTGTIILDAGPGQGRRALTLLPDFHICVIKSSQIVGNFPEAIQKLDAVVTNSGRPITMISGPSATSDIELDRVEGVHGPRKLHVFVVK